MKYLILFLLVSNFLVAQNYSVSDYQKINELNGGFSGILSNEDFFGISIDQIGDLDGNGVNDLAVGAYADDDGGLNKGAVWILFLNAEDQVISHTKISDTSGGFTGVLDNNDRFGGAVSYLGDMNSDGLMELAVGADYDGDGGFWHGAVWILSLNPDGTVNSHSKISDTQGGFTGVLAGESIFGTDIANIGDLNGDGIEDLAVGSRRIDTSGPRRGAVWILFMNSDFTVSSHQQISDTQGNFATTLDFEDYFGGSVANIGDLNGDGVVDIAVGAYRDDDLISNSGCFYVLFLNPDGTVNAHQKVSNSQGGLSNQISQDALFGESIDGLVDIDGDGKVEIVVGAMRQNNPTLSVATGGFFIIELNTDGTVSEEFFYSYAENCFSGNLIGGDLFGGSVCFLNEDNNNLKIAAGAYSDSENGFRRGAAWILNTGDVNYNLEATIDPSDCGNQNGSFSISGLVANSAYSIEYIYQGIPQSLTITSDSTGMLTVSNLGAGLYTTIVITEAVTGCTDTIEDIDLIAPGLSASISSTDPTGCGVSDGSITIAGLNPNTDYTFEYSFEGTMQMIMVTSDGTGMLTVTNLEAGLYKLIVVTEVLTGCTDTLEDVDLIAPDLSASISSTDPTGCGVSDGSITVSGLNPNTDYTLDFSYEGMPQSLLITSDSTGMLTVSNLDAGLYSSSVITEAITGCSDTLEDVVLIAPELLALISSSDPTACEVSDGSLIITGLIPNSEYILEYNYEGNDNSIMIISDNTGLIILSNLSSGIYNNIILIDFESNCFINFGSIQLLCNDTFACFRTRKYFTPNGDGYNDFWFLEDVSNSCTYVLMIYDRYGKLLKTLTPYSNKWDGTFNGAKMPTNDYWYVVEYTNAEGRKLEYRSHFTLKR